MVLERAGSADFEADRVLGLEHHHRYLWASKFLYGRMLDAGCGGGGLVRYIPRFGAVTEWVGIDQSPAAFDALRAERIEGKFVQGRLENLPFPDDYFDCIVTLEVLEHTTDPRQAIAEFRRVLRPDGILLGSIPSTEKEDFLVTRWGGNEFHIASPDEIFRFVEDEFPNVIHGYATLEISSVLKFDQEPFTETDCEMQLPTHEKLGSLIFAASSRPLPDKITQSGISVGVNEIDFLSRTTLPFEEIISSCGKLVEERNFYINKLESDIFELKSDLYNLTNERTNIDQRNIATLREKSAEIQFLNTTLENLHNNLREAAELVQARDRYISTLGQKITEHLIASNVADRLVRERDDYILLLEAGSQELREMLATSHQLTEDRDEQIARLDKAAAELRAALDAADRLVEERDDCIRVLEQDKQKLGAALDVANQHAAEQHREMVAKEAATTKLPAAFHAADARSERRGHQISELESANRDLHKALVAADSLVQNRDQYISALEVRDAELQGVLSNAGQLVEERSQYINSLEHLLLASRETLTQQEVYLRSCDLTISKNKIDIAELMNVARIQHEKRLHDEQEINRLGEKLGRIERSFVFRAVRWLSNDLLAFASSRKLP